MPGTANAERKHIVLAGRRNAGKSSLLNALLGQPLSIVSATPGTTTDPVKKAAELLPYGPVVFVDTAGLDDSGELGGMRVKKTIKALAAADLIVYVLDGSQPPNEEDFNEARRLASGGGKLFIAVHKADLGFAPETRARLEREGFAWAQTSHTNEALLYQLKERLLSELPDEPVPPLVGDLISRGDIVVLVVPIDLGAPRGRLIMPQVQTTREALDSDAVVVTVKDKELRMALNTLQREPKLVVTDSQAIMRVAADVPDHIPLTTFSILMARYKGELEPFVAGLRTVDKLQNGDRVLIAESCTHHAQEDDIGRVKIPRWLSNYTKQELLYDHAQGQEFPDSLEAYRLIIHCGGCMMTRRMMHSRLREAALRKVPIVNYGMLISLLHGAIPRALEPFPEAVAAWEQLP